MTTVEDFQMVVGESPWTVMADNISVHYELIVSDDESLKTGGKTLRNLIYGLASPEFTGQLINSSSRCSCTCLNDRGTKAANTPQKPLHTGDRNLSRQPAVLDPSIS